MSGLDGMIIWVSDFIAETQSLSTTELGALTLIRCAMWKADGWLPNDPKRLARIARLTSDKWRKVEPAIMTLLVVEGDRVTCKGLQHELEKTRKRIDQKRDAGRSRHSKEGKIPPCEVENNSPGQNSGINSNPLNDNGRGSADAERASSERPSETPGTLDSDSLLNKESEHKNESVSVKAPPAPRSRKGSTGTRLPDDWKPSDKDRQHARDHGLDDGQLAYLVGEFREYWMIGEGAGSTKKNWSLTFRNSIDNQIAWKRGVHNLPRKAATTTSSSTVAIQPGTEQWAAWRVHYDSDGKDFFVTQMDKQAEGGKPFPVPQEWPPDHEPVAMAA